MTGQNDEIATKSGIGAALAALGSILEQQCGLPPALAQAALAGFAPWAEARLVRFAEHLRNGDYTVIEDDPDRSGKAELLITTLPHVAEQRSDQIIDGLARIVRDGLTSDTTDRVDEVFHYRDTVVQLSRAHLHVLAEVVNANQRSGCSRATISTKQPGIRTILDKLLSECESLGLIFDPEAGAYEQPGYLGRRYAATEFGRGVWTYLEGSDRRAVGASPVRQ